MGICMYVIVTLKSFTLIYPYIGGYIYVCGATAMGEDVAHAIVEVVQKYKG